jgi:uncharacterized membrane protein YcjF (UPF0283 family)
MDRKGFTAAVKRLEEVDQVVRKLDPAIRGAAFSLLRGYVAVPGGRSLAVEELVLLVMMRAAEDAQRDLREVARDLEAANKQKARLRDLIESLGRESDELADRLRAEYDDLFVTSELGELESLRLQMAMDRQAKLFETLSNLLKKLADAESGIVENIK